MHRVGVLSEHCNMKKSVPKRIIIYRHAEREDHVRPDWGRTAVRPHDGPVSKNGKKQARGLGEAMKSAINTATDDVVMYSSPFIRCVQTYAIMSEVLYGDAGVAPPSLCIEELFSERGKNVFTRMMGTHAVMKDFGVERRVCHPVAFSASDLLCIHDNIDETYETLLKIGYDEEGRQVPYELEERLLSLAAFIALPRHSGKTIVIASHGGVTNEVVQLLTQSEPVFKCAYAQMYVLDYDAAADRWVEGPTWFPDDAPLEPWNEKSPASSQSPKLSF